MSNRVQDCESIPKDLPAFIKIALKQAYMVKDNRHRIGAVLVRGGKVLAASHNRATRHAEIRAMASLWPSERIGAVIWVVRPFYDRSRGLALAKPCQKCRKELLKSGIKKMIYSVEGGFVTERL